MPFKIEPCNYCHRTLEKLDEFKNLLDKLAKKDHQKIKYKYPVSSSVSLRFRKKLENILVSILTCVCPFPIFVPQLLIIRQYQRNCSWMDPSQYRCYRITSHSYSIKTHYRIKFKTRFEPQFLCKLPNAQLTLRENKTNKNTIRMISQLPFVKSLKSQNG